jgi:hypothetical protein
MYDSWLVHGVSAYCVGLWAFSFQTIAMADLQLSGTPKKPRNQSKGHMNEDFLDHL